MPGTGAKKEPNTGGPPLVLGALALLGAALIAGRNILMRWRRVVLFEGRLATKSAPPGKRSAML